MTRPVVANECRLHSAKFVSFEKKIPKCTIAIIIYMRIALLEQTEINSLRTANITECLCTIRCNT